METQATGNKLHPLIWVAAIAVILLSAAGIGAIFGVIPTADSSPKPVEPISAAIPATTAASAPVAVTAPVAAPKPAEQAAPVAKPAPKPKVVAKAADPKPEPAPQPEMKPAAPVVAQTAPAPVAPAICMNCGTIEDIRQIEQKGEGTGLGAVGGAVVGGLIGSQIGKGSGKTVATVVGAAGGGYAGHQVEKNVRKTVRHDVVVRLEDGATRVFSFDTQPSWRIGDRVKIENGVLVTR